jgi:hypothetical protein
MTPLSWGLLLIAIFIAGFALGYGARVVISRRHRAEARRRYETTGSIFE